MYWLDLPAFLLNNSPTNLTPFSFIRLWALKKECGNLITNCLSNENENLMIGFFPFSDIVSTVTSELFQNNIVRVTKLNLIF
jgi:hypothetical protein